eukprot:scaffold548786_cov67-Attheya_sp.AAC.2
MAASRDKATSGKWHVAQHCCGVSTWHARGSIAVRSILLVRGLGTDGCASDHRTQIGLYPIECEIGCRKTLPPMVEVSLMESNMPGVEGLINWGSSKKLLGLPVFMLGHWHSTVLEQPVLEVLTDFLAIENELP